MEWKNFSLKHQLLLSFTGFLILCLSAIQVMVWFQEEKSALQQVNTRLNKLSLAFNGMQRQEKAFMVDELFDPKFYERGESPVLKQQATYADQITFELNRLQQSKDMQSKYIDQQIRFIRQRLENHQLLFDSLVRLHQQKGFRDYGLVGKMRSYAHALERRVRWGKGMEHVLTLRRREKDYLLRKQNRYHQYFLRDYAEFRSYIKQSYPQQKREDLLYMLKNYREAFQELVQIDELIGRSLNEGLNKSLAQSADVMEARIQKLNAAISSESEELTQRINTYLAVILFVLGFLFLTVSLYASRMLSRPITRLSDAVRRLANSNFSEEVDIPEIKTKDELGKLSRDLKDMHQRLLSHHEELKVQGEQIQKANRIISLQKQKMDASSQSILAAQNIQQLILPTEEELSALFHEVFVYFRPRDIVSGDFYWYTLYGNDVIFATVDCTGHGVSGAFLSFIANEMLQDIIHNKGITQASKILDALHLSIQPYLGQVASRDNVGMDISLCVWNERDQLLQFAGAVNPLVLVQDGELRIIKGDRRSIGGLSDEFIDWEKEDFQFTQHHIRIQDSTEVYLFSDGYKDQLGGEKGKRFRSSRLYELFRNIQGQTAEQKRQTVDTVFQEWKGNRYNQLDDIMVVGLTLDPRRKINHRQKTQLSQLNSRLNR